MTPLNLIILAVSFGTLGAIASILLRRFFVKVPAAIQEMTSIDGIHGRGLRGSVGDIGLPPLLNLIATERKSGILTVWQGETIGRLTCRDGEVISCMFEVHRDIRGEEAVYSVLDITEGTFVFEPKVIAPQLPTLGKSITYYLMESARRSDLKA